MKFPYTSILFLGIFFLGLMFLRCSAKAETAVENYQEGKKVFSLKVERGAFHYDTFLLEDDTLHYIPQEKANHPNPLYNMATNRVLDSSVTQGFISRIIKDGFLELQSHYKSSSTCTAQLRITLEVNDRLKTVICDDFERDCPELIKYIDQKVVDLEGNGLKRIYLPG